MSKSCAYPLEQSWVEAEATVAQVLGAAGVAEEGVLGGMGKVAVAMGESIALLALEERVV